MDNDGPAPAGSVHFAMMACNSLKSLWLEGPITRYNMRNAFLLLG
jgi:hypothetical protein